MKLRAILSFVALMVLVAIAALLSVVPARAHNGWQHLFGMSSEEGSGVRESEDRDVGAFTRIDIVAALEVNVTVGKPQKVTVTIDDNLLDNVKTRVHDGTLEITTRRSYSTDEMGRIDIQVEKLEEVTLRGSGDVKVANLDGDKFDFVLAGSGNFNADGKINELSVTLEGSGDVDTRKLVAQNVNVVISGSGNVRVLAHSSLDGTVNGSGNIEYTGEPEHVASHVNGSGHITRES